MDLYSQTVSYQTERQMLFTNFLKSKENLINSNNTNEPKPQDSGIIKPLVSGYISNRLSKQEYGITQTKIPEPDKQNIKKPAQCDSKVTATRKRGSSIADTMAKVRHSTPTKQHLPSTPTRNSNSLLIDDDPNPLHRLSNRRSHARSRSRSITRSKLSLSKASSTTLQCSSFILEQPPKLCINCQKFIPAHTVSVHQQNCVGFERLLKMNKQELFMFVHEKIVRDQMALERLAGERKKGVVVIGEEELRGEYERRIVCLHKVRNGVMTKLV